MKRKHKDTRIEVRYTVIPTKGWQRFNPYAMKYKFKIFKNKSEALKFGRKMQNRKEVMEVTFAKPYSRTNQW